MLQGGGSWFIISYSICHTAEIALPKRPSVGFACSTSCQVAADGTVLWRADDRSAAQVSGSWWMSLFGCLLEKLTPPDAELSGQGRPCCWQEGLPPDKGVELVSAGGRQQRAGLPQRKLFSDGKPSTNWSWMSTEITCVKLPGRQEQATP